MKKKIFDENDPWPNMKLGKVIKNPDFLPSPEELAAAEKKTKVTLELSESSLKFFKDAAKRTQMPYQLMIRRVLDSYCHQVSH